MKPWITLGRAEGPSGERFELVQRGDEFVIRANGRLLMSSRQHGSEEAMAEEVPRDFPGRMLIGGLGLGYTLRAVLDRVGSTARVEVVELSEAIVRWNRGVLAPLAGSPLDDSRVQLTSGDVGSVLRKARGEYDAVLLDVDNGPEALTRESNDGLYRDRGLLELRRALRPKGVAVFWSAAEDPAFRSRLVQAGFRVEVRTIRRQGVTHRLFVGHL